MSETRAGGADAPAVDPVGRVMGGRFRVGRMLGAGGMGTVHEAVDLGMDRPVALKLLRPELAKDHHQLQRFEREARAAAKLSHPNVVGVTELVRDETLGLGLVMELLLGKSLASRLDDGPLSETEAVNVLMQALDGLATAHAAGMVHRDLKPSNVFLVPLAGGVLVKLLDFGIVKLAEDGASPKLTRKGALIGTPTYMSPEQVSCAPVDARSDVYAMGACLYEALIARPPYEEPHSLALIAAVGAGPPRDLHEIDRAVSPDLVHIVRVAMARDPAGRYQSASAMREALRGAVIAKGPARPRPERAATMERAVASSERTRALIARAGPSAGSRAPALALAAVALAVAVAVAGVLAVAARARSPRAPAPSATFTSAPAASAPVPTTTVAVPRAPDALPRGIEPPEPIEPIAPRTIAPPPTGTAPTTTRVPAPPPSTRAHPPRTHGRVGEDVLDPFASP